MKTKEIKVGLDPMTAIEGLICMDKNADIMFIDKEIFILDDDDIL